MLDRRTQLLRIVLCLYNVLNKFQFWRNYPSSLYVITFYSETGLFSSSGELEHGQQTHTHIPLDTQYLILQLRLALNDKTFLSLLSTAV
jgi:hypothetical protein